MTKEEYWFWLSNISNFWQNDIKKLLEKFTCIEEIYEADKLTLIERGRLQKDQADRLIDSRKSGAFLLKMEYMNKNGIVFIHPDSERYPEKFRSLSDMPYSIYVKGNLPDESEICIGMIGARACSSYGKEMAKKFSQALASNGIQIVSGMAVGIDTESAKGALDFGGKTFAVLGSGVDIIYPRENINLYYNIIMNGGGIISEYPLGTRPWPWQFPHRNRLISAFSDKLLVLEAGKNSGTLSTVGHALDQGKDIYALPGRINDRLSEGCNNLIADGAGILLSPELLLESLVKEDFCMLNSESDDDNLINACNNIYKFISYEPTAVDEIIEKTGLDLDTITQYLSELEIEGVIIQVATNCYARANV